jgi:hypothetical protein
MSVREFMHFLDLTWWELLLAITARPNCCLPHCTRLLVNKPTVIDHTIQQLICIFCHCWWQWAQSDNDEHKHSWFGIILPPFWGIPHHSAPHLVIQSKSRTTISFKTSSSLSLWCDDPSEYSQLVKDHCLLQNFIYTCPDPKEPHSLPVNLHCIVQNAKQIFHIDPWKPSNLELVDTVQSVKDLGEHLIVVPGHDPLQQGSLGQCYTDILHALGGNVCVTLHFEAIPLDSWSIWLGFGQNEKKMLNLIILWRISLYVPGSHISPRATL